MNSKFTAYAEANTHSFTLQAKELNVPVSDTTPTVMTLGIQPFGITSQPFGNVGDVVAVANYMAPAQHIGKVTIAYGVLTRQITRISGAMHGPTWFRGGFPNIDPVAQANRCWTVVLGEDGSGDILAGRGDADFYRITSPREGKSTWTVTERITLPRTYGNHPHKFVASATLLSGDRFFTVEHDGEYECEALEWEGLSARRIRLLSAHKLGRFRYGIALGKLGGLERVVSITSFHSKEPAGVYFGNKQIVPGIYGDGITPLINGGVLVTRRGMESPEGDSLEVPGALIYIPPSMFPASLEWVR